MQRLLVLGGGTAGTMVVNKLRRQLDPADWQITDRRPGRQASVPARVPVHPVRRVPAGRRGAVASSVHPRRRRTRARRDRPGRRRCTARCSWPTDGSSATTTWSSPPARRRGRTRLPACSARSGGQSIFDFYSLDGAHRPGQRRCASSTAAGSSCTSPTCRSSARSPRWSSPSWPRPYFRDRGMRDRVEIDLRDAAARRVHQADRIDAARLDARRAQDRARDRLHGRADRRRGQERWSPTTSARFRSTCS